MTQQNSFGPKPPVPPRVPLPRGNSFVATAPARPYRDPKKTMWIVILLLIIGGYLAFAVYRGMLRPVYLVNGLDKAYSVTINGRSYDLPPLSHTKISVSEGDLNVAVSDSSLGIVPQTCQIKTSFFKRPFQNKTFCVNPDLAAIVYMEEQIYSKNPVNSSLEPGFRCGELLVEFDGLDYEFAEFPSTISVDSRSSSDVPKLRIDQYTKGTPMERMQVASLASEQAVPV